MNGNIVGKLYTYERRPEFYKVIKENVSNLGLDNVTVKNKDLIELSEKNVDLIVLDMLDPENVLDVVVKALKKGGFLVLYMPSITQIVSFLKKAVKKDLLPVRTVETLQRQWKIEDKIVRPEFRMLGHTGFLSFFRKV